MSLWTEIANYIFIFAQLYASEITETPGLQSWGLTLTTSLAKQWHLQTKVVFLLCFPKQELVTFSRINVCTTFHWLSAATCFHKQCNNSTTWIVGLLLEQQWSRFAAVFMYQNLILPQPTERANIVLISSCLCSACEQDTGSRAAS